MMLVSYSFWSLASNKSQKYSIYYFSNYICPKISTKLLCIIDKLYTSGASGNSSFCTAKHGETSIEPGLTLESNLVDRNNGFSNRWCEYLTRFEALQAISLKNTRYIILVIIYALKLERNYYAQSTSFWHLWASGNSSFCKAKTWWNKRCHSLHDCDRQFKTRNWVTSTINCKGTIRISPPLTSSDKARRCKQLSNLFCRTKGWIPTGPEVSKACCLLCIIITF